MASLPTLPMLRRPLLIGLALILAALAACGGGGGDAPAECAQPCFSPPDPACNGDTLVRFAFAGECVEGTCQYDPESQRDCAADGQVCQDGACVEPPTVCDDVVCDSPPPPSCESEDAIYTYPGIGTCEVVDGEPRCNYEPVRDTCRRSQWCVDGDCVPRPCFNVECLEPPARQCVGDVITEYVEVGTCDMETEECVYAVTSEVDCAATDQYCNRARCVDRNPCEGVICSEVPDPYCAGSILHTFGAGVCSSGDCGYPETTRNCAATGLLCRDAECRARRPCEDVVCDAAPEPYCDGDELVTFGDAGTCEADDCSYPITRTNCDETGQICRSGACVAPDPCDGELCYDRPESFCSGSVAVRYEVPGLCVDGVCRFTETGEDCADTGRVCFAGDCESEDPCEGLSCNTLPTRYCDANTAVSFGFPSECVDGECIYTEYTESCDGIGSRCAAGTCVTFDPCADVSCSPLPANRCVGDVVYTWSGSVGCVEGECPFDRVLRTTDCAATGRVCRDAACVLPGTALDPGDLLIVEIAPATVGSDRAAQWMEIAVGEGITDLSGLRVVNAAGTAFTLPVGSYTDGYFVLGGSASAVPGGPDYVWPAGFQLAVSSETIRLSTGTGAGAREIDALSWTAAGGWNFTTGRAFALSTYGETIRRNDDRAEWCNSPSEYATGLYGTPGASNGACGGPVRAGNLRVTEIMPDGNARPGGIEQWVEVLNTTAGTLDVSGVRISTTGGAFVFPWGSTIASGAYHVIGVDGSVAAIPDSFYGLDMPIAPAGDVLTVRMGTVLVEQVDFSAGELGGFPYGPGQSMQRAVTLNPSSPESWCPGAQPYDGYAENLGSPGDATVCPE